MDVSEHVRTELDRIYGPKLAVCQWEAHRSLLIEQRNMLEDTIMRVLERMERPTD
jgi:hypothetical protein